MTAHPRFVRETRNHKRRTAPWSPGLHPAHPDVSVVVPTYREAENLPALIPRIVQATLDAGLTAEVVIVDDDSQDGTPFVCASLERDLACRIRLLTRRGERGLASAAILGLREARGHTLLVMDADLSHPPELIPQLVAALSDPAVDFAIGSRYLPGGTTEDSWGVGRWLNSKVATILARPFSTVSDPMSGFFALRRSTWDRSARLDPVGYKVGLELMVKCRCQRVQEIPIHFCCRLHGQSKLTWRQQVEYLRHLWRLARYKWRAAA